MGLKAVLCVLCSLGVLLLPGCYTSYWNKPGATQQGFQRDYSACEQDARLIGPLVRPLRLEHCMTARGYEITGTKCGEEIAGIEVQVQCSVQ